MHSITIDFEDGTRASTDLTDEQADALTEFAEKALGVSLSIRC